MNSDNQVSMVLYSRAPLESLAFELSCVWRLLWSLLASTTARMSKSQRLTLLILVARCTCNMAKSLGVGLGGAPEFALHAHILVYYTGLACSTKPRGKALNEKIRERERETLPLRTKPSTTKAA